MPLPRRILKAIRTMRDAGVTLDVALAEANKNLRASAKEQGWRPSELAMGIANWEEAIRGEYAKRRRKPQSQT